VRLSTIHHLNIVITDANHRRSFFGVIRLFGPNIQEVVMTRYGDHDRRLRNEANRVIDARIADLVGPTAANESYIRLKTKFELESALYVEYRYAKLITAKLVFGIHALDTRDSYFSAINLIGDGIFNFVLDFHAQRDGVGERDGARIDDMIERIRHAAD